MLNIGKETLSKEEKIAKYMPFVFFGDGERPQPVIEKNPDISENKGSWFVHTSTSADGIKSGAVGRKINPDEKISGRNMEYCSGLFTDDNEQGFNIEFAQEMADLLNKNGISDLHEAQNFINNEIAECDDFSDINTEKIDISADSEFIQQVVRDVEELQISDDEDISDIHDITFLGDNSKFDAVKAVINTESFGTTFVDSDRLSVIIKDDADINDVRQLIETAINNEIYLNVSSSNFLKNKFGDDFLEINSSDKEYTLEVSMTSDAFDEPYCIAKIDANGEFIDYYEDIDGNIPAFYTIAETLDYAKKYKLDVTNNLEEIPENLFYTLQDVVDKYFGADCYSAETVDGAWKISVADGDKFAEIFHNDTAICGIYNRDDKIEIEPYEESTSSLNVIADAMLKHNPDKPVEIMDLVDDKNIDKPLFTDADVIEEIEKSENSTDNRPFWETPDISGEQLSMFGDSVSLAQKRQSEPKKEKFAEGLFVGNTNRFTALHDEIIRGTGFQDGKFRVKQFYDEKKPTNKEFADFLKHEYGIGGHSGDGEIYFVDHDSKGMFFTHENGEKFKFTWTEIAEMTASIIEKG